MLGRTRKTPRTEGSKLEAGKAATKSSEAGKTSKRPNSDPPLTGAEPTPEAKRLLKDSRVTETTRSTGLGAGAAGAIQLNREPIQLSEEARARLLQIWNQVTAEADAQAAEKAKAAAQAEQAQKAAIEAMVAATTTYADFSALPAGSKDDLFRAVQYGPSGSRIEVVDHTESQPNGRSTSSPVALAKKVLGARNWTLLCDEVKAQARASAESTGNGRVRVEKPTLDWISELRSGAEVWGWEIQVSSQWSDRYNSDRDVWLNVRIDRDGAEFHRHTGQGH